MRKMTALLLSIAVILSLTGCRSDLKPVDFYYPRQTDSIQFGVPDGLISSDPREVAGHTGDLRYLISLYLRGPLDSGLQSPFPEGTMLEDISTEDGVVTVSLSREFSQLSGMELTLACACLSSTCFGLTDAEFVTILSPKTELYSQVEVTMDRNCLTLLDDSPVAAE